MEKIFKFIPFWMIEEPKFSIDKKTFKFAKLMEEGVKFPPIHLQLLENGMFKIRDGRHRATSVKLNGKNQILAWYKKKQRKLKGE